MLFTELVAVVEAVRRHKSRADQVTELRACFEERSSTEVATAIGLMLRTRLGDLPQTPFTEPDVEARARASITCEQVAETVERIDRAPAEAFRRNLIRELLAETTRDEWPLLAEMIEGTPFHRPTFDLIVSSVAKSARIKVRDVRRAATVSGSLPLVARIALERGEVGIRSVGLEPGRPIPPTVVERIARPEQLLESPSSVLVEWNIRAVRIQAHRLRGVVTIYDDTLADVTDRLPAVVEQVANLDRRDLVLDGWVDADRQPTPESTTGARWTRRHASSEPVGRALFFDILFDDASVVDEPLATRRELLAAVVPPDELVPIVPAGTLDEVAAAMNESIRLGHDGLILKPLDAPYEGGFVRSSWRAIEQAAIRKLVVVAAERGAGNRSHLLSIVHLAALDEHGELTEIGRASVGLNDDLVVRQTGVFAELTLPGSDGGSGRLFRLRPEVIAVVAMDGVEESDEYPAGWTLRRPRVIGFLRGDEVSVTTIDELCELARHRSGSPTAGTVTHLVGARGVEAEQPPAPFLPDPTPPVASAGSSAHANEVAAGAASVESHAERALASVGRSVGTPLPARRAIQDIEFEPYTEPELPTSRRWHRGVIQSRLLVLAWVLALLLTAWIERTGDAAVDTSAVGRVGLAGVVVVVALIATGWAWTDQLVRTLKLLDGRRPTRARCVSAWLTPPLTVLALALLVAPLEPTTPADVRPAILAGAFLFAMWRPYALLRRIMRTLTRTPADSLIAVAYVGDVVIFGILWWRLTQWASQGPGVSQREIDVLISTLGAVAIAAAVNLVIWRSVIRATDAAVAFRKSSQRTRYEHRMLRLRGADPTDPEVWWALIQRHADEQRRARASEAERDADTRLPSVDDLVARARDENRTAFRRLDTAESTRLEQRLREEFAAILGADEEQQRLEPNSNGGASGDEPVAPATSADDESIERDEDPITALRRRAGQDPDIGRSDIEELISRAGSLEIDAAITEHRDRLRDGEPGVRLVPPRLAGIESVRLLMVLAFGALTLAAAALTVISLGSDVTGSDGELASSVVDDLELARNVFWALFTVGTALLPVWALTVVRQARRTGLAGLRVHRLEVLSAISFAACVASFVLDGTDRGGVTIALMIPIIWSAVAAGFCVEPVREWFDLPGATLTAWIATLPAILGVAWLAGLSSDIGPDASLQGLAFTTILLTLGCARVAVMAVLSSVDLENELRAAPELAVPANPRRPAPERV